MRERIRHFYIEQTLGIWVLDSDSGAHFMAHVQLEWAFKFSLIYVFFLRLLYSSTIWLSSFERFFHQECRKLRSSGSCVFSSLAYFKCPITSLTLNMLLLKVEEFYKILL